MKVYIAGPIASKPNKNQEAFADAAQRLKAMGHEPVNPHEISVDHEGVCRGALIKRTADDGQCVWDQHQYGCYMKPDLIALLDCDAYVLLPGWMDSPGASTEYQVARICGLLCISL